MLKFPMEQIKTLKIDPAIIWQVLLTGALIFLAYTFSEVIIMFLIAFIIYAGLKPAVDWLQNKGLPRGLAISLIIIGLLLILIGGGVIITSQLALQLRALIGQLPEILQSFSNFIRTSLPGLAQVLPLDALSLETSKFLQQVINSEALNQFLTSGDLFGLVAKTVGAFGTAAGLILELFTILMVSVYLLARKQPIIDQVAWLIPNKWQVKAQRIAADTEVSLGSWMRGQVLLMVIIGVATYLILAIPGLFIPEYTLDNYALTIAIIAGILELLPNIGPAITLMITSVIALGTSGFGALIYVAISFLGLQNLESVLIVPAVMKRAVGIDPIVTILAIVGAFQVFGIVGAILVVPIVVIVKILLREAISE